MARSGVSRRELLKRAGLAGGALVAMPGLGGVLQSGAVLAQPRTLSAAAFATLHAICARLIPTDERGPGATEAHAAEYIDRALRSALAPSRGDYTKGLGVVDARARERFALPFAKLSPAQQDDVLTAIQDTPFFGLVRGHTLQGTFCDPIYGGNANFVGWDLIGYPGVRTYCDRRRAAHVDACKGSAHLGVRRPECSPRRRSMATELKKTDVVVIGLGATGGVAVLPLTQAGVDVVGLEAGAWMQTADFAPDESATTFARGRRPVQKTHHEIPTHRVDAGAPHPRRARHSIRC